MFGRLTAGCCWARTGALAIGVRILLAKSAAANAARIFIQTSMREKSPAFEDGGAKHGGWPSGKLPSEMCGQCVPQFHWTRAAALATGQVPETRTPARP